MQPLSMRQGKLGLKQSVDLSMPLDRGHAFESLRDDRDRKVCRQSPYLPVGADLRVSPAPPFMARMGAWWACLLESLRISSTVGLKVCVICALVPDTARRPLSADPLADGILDGSGGCGRGRHGCAAEVLRVGDVRAPTEVAGRWLDGSRECS